MAVESATAAGAAWLVRFVRGGCSTPAAPIGLYFASLWYYEELYPLVFATGTLARVCRLLEQRAGEDRLAR